jgi:hypothetical protein
MTPRRLRHTPAITTERPPAAPARSARESRAGLPRAASLGADPLAHIEGRLSTRRQQVAVVAAMLPVAGAAFVSGNRWALAVVVGCVVAEIALAASLLMLASDRRARVLELIAHGHGHLPLSAVQGERHRLLTASHCTGLARSLHELADEARLRHACPRPGHSLYSPAVLAALATELHATARRLEEEATGVAGVALAELLLTAHDSPLYGTDTTRLGQELRRIDFALRSGESASQAGHAICANGASS